MNRLSRPLLAGLAAAAAAVLLLPPAGAAEPAGDYGAAPYMEKLWSQPTVREKQTQNWLNQAATLLENRGQVPLVDFYPTGAKGRVLFRSTWGVHAVNLDTGKLDWEADSRWSLDQMVRGEKCFWVIILKGGPDELIGRIDLWPDDGVSRDQRGFWLDPEFQGRGLMTEAAERVTEYAFVELGWPHLWLSNAEANNASGRIKEKQGARLVDREPAVYVSGEGARMVWLLEREDWLARHSGR